MNNLIIYMVVLLGLDAGMGYCAYVAKNMKGELAKKIFRMEVIGVITIFFASIYQVAQNSIICYISRAVFYFFSDILVIRLYQYARIYTGLTRERKWLDYIFYFISTLEGISFFSNVKTHHAFLLEPTNSFDVITFYKIAKSGIAYYMHFAFFYCILLAAMVLLAVKMTKVPSFYRMKYGMVLWTFGIAFACNVIFGPMDLTVDYSLWAYCIMGTAICYFSLIFLPKGLVEKTLATVMLDLNSGIVCYDLNGNCMFINELAKQVYQVKSEEGLELQSLYEECFNNSKKITDDYIEWEENREFDGEEFTYLFHFQYFEDVKGGKLGSYVTIFDRTEEIRNYEREHHRATHDLLTGLYNREYFFQKVTEQLHRDMTSDYTMICTDIKDFKLVNDLFGIEKGNEVLIRQAGIIDSVAGPHWVYGRLMGDKFACLMRTEEFKEDEMIECLSEIRNSFEGTDFHLHINFGVYHIKDREEAPSIMCDRASLAINTLRGDYSRMVAYYDEALMNKTMEDKRLVNDFDKAIANDEFVIYIQPQCNQKEEVRGGEALVRWIHPELGFMAPGKFIEVYEKTGLIYRLDEYIWEQAAKLLRKWADEGKDDFYISVNISPLDFYYTDIYKTITSLVEKYKINPANYKLEITETAIMSEVQKNLKILNRLKRYGFHVEMDDFGSGYSSLNTLKDIPADVIKIDMGFLRETVNVERSRIILQSIIELAHKLGMSVICEGVEQREQIESLKEMGCEMFQGYYFSKPIPVEDFEKNYM